jgi:hypothetical protein
MSNKHDIEVAKVKRALICAGFGLAFFCWVISQDAKNHHDAVPPGTPPLSQQATVRQPTSAVVHCGPRPHTGTIPCFDLENLA